MSAPASPPPQQVERVVAPPRINGVVFVGAAAGTLAVALWGILDPAGAESTIAAMAGWTADRFGWFYVLLATVVLVFVVLLAGSRHGRVRLGPDDSRPEFSTFSWSAMLFAAGIGTDLMFFSVAEPVTQYLDPPSTQPETVDAAREATVWTLFHYGISGWAMYALMGMALAYFAYRLGLPLAIRSSLRPVFGSRVDGRLGDAVDLAAIVGTIFGVATSLGIGVVQLNFGLHQLFGIGQGLAAQIALIVLAVTMATVSAVSGLDRGIKRLSQLNVLLAIGLGLWILVTGRTLFLLNAAVLNVGDFVRLFPEMTLQTFAHEDTGTWMDSWTLFFWAWWIAWASFVGLFLARISRGRTIRQFVAGTLIIPFSYILMWVSIFGNSAIDLVRSGDKTFGELTLAAPEEGFYTLLAQYPGFTFIASVATFVGLLFYVTSADSGALVMANLSSRLDAATQDAAPGPRIFWAVATGLLTIAMLSAGGIYVLQYATVIMGLPFACVMVLVMVGLYRALRAETPGAHESHAVPHGGWQSRVRRLMSFPSRTRAGEFLDTVVLPALRDVAAELRAHGVVAEALALGDEPGGPAAELSADLGGGRTFGYRVQHREAPMPGYGGWAAAKTDLYSRLEVHLREGDEGYDVMGYTRDQLIDDVLDQYERHLELLRLGEGSGV